MIIKYTFKDNDYTQIIEKHLDEFGPFLAMSYNTISEHKEFIENVRKYNEMSINNTERKELKQKLVKTIKQAFQNYINSIKPNSKWQTDGINAEDLNDSKQYIFENIKKAVHFLLATNIGEIVTIFIGLLLGIKSPLLAIQLLWVNLVTDSLPAIALGLEPPEKDIMNKKPRDSKKSLFADGLWGKIFTEGIMLGMLTLLSFSIGSHLYSVEVGRTMAFVSLGILELVHSFNIRSEESIFKMGLFKNKYLIGAFALGTLLQVLVVVIPSFAEIFKLVPLAEEQWLYTVGISIIPIAVMEIQKKVNEIKFGKRVYEELGVEGIRSL